MSLQTEDDDGEETEIAIPDERYSPRGWPSAPTGTPCSARRAPDDCREILALREARGLSYDEIAAALSLEVGTVKSAAQRARKSSAWRCFKSGNFFPTVPVQTKEVVKREKL